MDKKEWYDAGTRVGDLVQSAFDSRNYDKLSRQVNEACAPILEAVRRRMEEAQKEAERAEKIAREGGSYRAEGGAYQRARANSGASDFGSIFPGRMSKAKKRTLTGILSQIIGYGMAIGSGMAAVTMGILGAATGFFGFQIFAWFFVLMTVAAVIWGNKGGGARAREKRLEVYLRTKGERDVVTVEELAAAVRRPAEFVRADLQKMINSGMFETEAYLDDAGANLITSHEAYAQYRQTMKAYAQRQAAQAQERARAMGSTPASGDAEAAGRRAETQTAGSEYSEEVRKILDEGREFVAHIHECNEDIQDPVLTEKLNRLESVVTHIFNYVAASPESAPDLHKMMSYYLPITRKLVDAYRDMDASKISGRNVDKSKKEISDSLDTINAAFEVLLDSFFEDTEFDISADIATLETMMARDGLTGRDDFVPGGRTAKVAKDLEAKSGSGAAHSGAAAAGSGSGAAAAGGAAGAAAAAPAPKEE